MGQADSSKSTTHTDDASSLPDGPGKDLVVKNCLACHSVKTTTSKRGSEDDWAQTVSTMIGKGANLTDDQAEQVVEYMAKHFGPTDTKPSDAPPAAH